MTWATISGGCWAPSRSRPGTSCAAPARTARRPRTRPPSRTRRKGRRPRQHPRDQSPRLGRPGGPGGRGQRRRGQVSDADRVRHPGPAPRHHRPAGPPDGGVRLPCPAAGRRSAVPGRQRPGRPGSLPDQHGRRRAARPDERGRAADPQLGRARPRVPPRLRPGATPDPPLRQHGWCSRDPGQPVRVRRRAGRREPVRPHLPGTTTCPASRRTAGTTTRAT